VKQEARGRPFRRTVGQVAQDGQPAFREVNPDLVLAPREGHGLHEQPSRMPLQQPEPRLSLAPSPRHALHAPLARGRQPVTNRPGVGHVALGRESERVIDLLHLAAGEGAREAGVRRDVLCKHDHTGDVAVQAVMHRKVGLPACGHQPRLDQAHEVRPRRVRGGVGGKARRLVDRDQHLVLVQDAQGRGIGRRRGGQPLEIHVDLEPRPRPHGKPRPPHGAASHAHGPRHHQPAHRGARQRMSQSLGEPGLQHDVQALSFVDAAEGEGQPPAHARGSHDAAAPALRFRDSLVAGRGRAGERGSTRA